MVDDLIVLVSIIGALSVIYYYLAKSNSEKNKIENFRQKLIETHRK